MEKKSKLLLVSNYLDELYPNPVCELNYNKDYELLIAVVLSAQATDKSVNKVTSVLFSKYPSLEALNEAKVEDIMEIIRSVGTYNRKSVYVKEIVKILINQYDGKVPNDRDKLIEMPGVGRKVANVILGELFHEAAIAVDTHVERVSKRLGIAKSNDSILEVENKLMKFFPKKEWAKRHLQLVLFGRYQCRSQRPICDECKLKDICKKKN